MPLMFEHLGIDRAFEHSVIELPFYLWQYNTATQCNMVTAPTATTQEVWTFLNRLSAAANVSDRQVEFYGPYFYQAATQFGYPGYPEDHMLDLLMHPGTDTGPVYSPKGVPTPYDANSMEDVRRWIRTEARRIMFIYGQNDPWSAAAATLGTSPDTFLYTQANGNHGSRVSQLAAADQMAATATIRSWAGVAPVGPDVEFPTAEEVAEEMRQRGFR
jgi:hypothetical protein